MQHRANSSGTAWFRSCAYLLVCVLLLSACKGGAGGAGKEGDAEETEAVTVEVAPVQERLMAASYTGTAPLEASVEAQVVAKTSGVALKVLVSEGDTVRAGQTLVRLDSDRARLQVAQTASQVGKLRNQFERAQKLAAEQLIAAADYDQIRYDLANAQAANRMANLELSYADVKAPINGVVASVPPKAGNFIQINTPIVRIVDISTLEATLNVPERELATMSAGLPVSLAVDALPGKTFTGVVERISPVVDSGSGTFRVIARFDSEGALQAGMFGRISINYGQRADAMVVPRNALLEGEGDPAVFVLEGDKVRRAAIQTGYSDGSWVEVLDGLSANDRVVVAGKTTLRDGSAVTVIDTAAPPPAPAVPAASATEQ
ncbi:efflux RND transporter periplasmic adaptor subunit [Lysobacter sp. H21R4]|uniref:efflux RND transporter periplasmic adaptor subunit n=1 Tax=Lysobacter sp. H21R4 TaxID=2781021 RepID=UPI001887BEB3|nr:efflux RND transporter periplasmic adaptor subunit [Lysobacter sp. H21R4]QOY63818.1 efflux RND transporter periplasmic adaptor subunit [Lysobacter sp. H21R4]